MSDNSGQEVEVKLRVADAITAATRLSQSGFVLLHPREYEDNLVFDTTEATIRRGGKLLRLRRARDRNVLTYKGPAVPSKHKLREEIETDISDFPRFQLILERLGYIVTFRYEKYRSEYWRTGEPGVVTLDETPIGVYLELEGPAAWIDETAALLGYSDDQYITASYGTLYVRYCQETGESSRDMLFAQSHG